MINNFCNYINDKDKEYVIFDIGSRDCEQSIEFYNIFPNARIYAFECNPNTLELCRKNILNYNDRITLIETAITDYDGNIKFYPIDKTKTITTWDDGNPGASSLFVSNGHYPYEKYVQYEIDCSCNRLDTLMKKLNILNVDLIWMDLQGAELLALSGLGEYLNNVKLIHTEISYKEMYTGQVLFSELNNFLNLKGFNIINKLQYRGWQEDVIYKNKNYIDLFYYEKKIFSQNGEDGITEKLIELIYNEDNSNKFFVEFGVQNGSECNTRILREKYKWNGLQMDGDYENHNINLKKEWILKENIINLFKKYNVPENINLLCVDIDFNDFYCLKEILSLYKCDIIICEYNATHTPDMDKVIIYDKNGRWDNTNYFGASLLTLNKLAIKYHYSLVYCDNMGVNCFFIHNDIIKNKNLHFENIGNIYKIYKPPRYGRGPSGGHHADIKNRKYISFDEAITL